MIHKTNDSKMSFSEIIHNREMKKEKAEGIAMKYNLHVENPSKSQILSAMQEYHESQLQELREQVEAEKETQLDKYKSAFVATDEEVSRWGQVKAFEKMEELIDNLNG